MFFDLYPAVIKTIEVIRAARVAGMQSCRSAENLMICTTKFLFIIAFIMTKKCLAYIKGLTTSLQKRAKEICQAYSEVRRILSALSEVRETIDAKRKEWFDTAISLGQKINALPPQLPRRCSRQGACW